MTCEKAWPLLSGHMDGENTPEEEEKLRAHLSICPACKELLEAYEGVDRQVAKLNVEAPEGLKEGVMYRIQTQKQPQKKKRKWFIGPGTAVGVVAAILVLLVGTGKVQMPGLKANTTDAGVQPASQAATTAAVIEDDKQAQPEALDGYNAQPEQMLQAVSADALLPTSAADSPDYVYAGDGDASLSSGAQNTDTGKRKPEETEITKQERRFCVDLSGDNTCAVLLLDGLSEAFPEQMALLEPALGKRLQDLEPEVQDDGTLVYETDYDTIMAIQEWFLLALSPQDEEETSQEQTAQEQTTQGQTAQEATEGFEQIGWQRVLELDPQSGYLASVLIRLPEELQIDQWPEDWPEDWNEKWKTGDNWALFFPEEHYEPVDGDLAYLVLTP